MTQLLRRLRRAMIPRALHPYHRAEKSIVRLSGQKVMAGPFAGQLYPCGPEDYVDPEMLLGLYECEINSWVDRILTGGYDRFIDVGSAQGYYVIGVARLCPATHVIGFEISKPAISQMERAARANGVADRIELRGSCDFASLADALVGAERPVVLIDVDGYEKELLDPQRIPALRKTTMLIEEHSFLVPGLKQLLIERFSPTHEISEIVSRLRTADDLPPGYQSRWHVMNVNRRADQQGWLWMTPRADA